MRKDLRYSRNDQRVVALRKAIRAAGGLTPVARMFGISPQAVYKWEVCPKHRVMQLAWLSGTSISDLRPDLYAPEPNRLAS